ncbi:STAS-like domain-containing protein [Streptococcus merionis]|uniref:STAS-like domain-containing protein n=1 Tax=Streptococcus merionis TaxID=400065 RepID=UPI003518F461
MVTIIVKDIVANHSDNASGQQLYEVIIDELTRHESVTISFEGIPYISTSFVNTAFINLLQDYTFPQIKEKLKFTRTTKQINELIKSRFAFETTRPTVA